MPATAQEEYVVVTDTNGSSLLARRPNSLVQKLAVNLMQVIVQRPECNSADMDNGVVNKRSSSNERVENEGSK